MVSIQSRHSNVRRTLARLRRKYIYCSDGTKEVDNDAREEKIAIVRNNIETDLHLMLCTAYDAGVR